MASGAEYLIDISARMPAGEATVSQLDALTSELMGAGKGADVFRDALARVSSSLDTAKASSISANEALAQGKAEYALLERAALQASKAAERAAQKNAGVVPDDLADKVRATHHEVGQFTVRLAQLETEANDAAAAEGQLARQLANVRQMSQHVDRSLAQQNERLGKLQSALGAVGGPLGVMGQRIVGPVKGFSELSSSIGRANAAALLGVAAIGALVAVVVVLSAALVAGVAAVATWAVGLADGARSAGLAQEAIEAMHPGLVALRGTMTDLTAETGVGADKLRALAVGLEEAGESSSNMAGSLRVAALAQAALGDTAAQKYLGLVKAATDATAAAEKAAEKTGAVPKELARQVDETTRAVEDFASAAQTKLGGVVARQMLGLEAQGARLGGNFRELFSGLDIEPVLAGMQTLVDLFDKSEASGQAIKFLFESVFQPLIDQAENAAFVVEAFALGFLIGMTKTYIALKPVFKGIEEFLGLEDMTLRDTLELATDAGQLFAYALTAAFVAGGILVAALLAIPATVAGVAAVFVAFWKSVGETAARIGLDIKTGIEVAIVYLKTIDFMQIGRDMMTGLANGITGAATAVTEAVTRVMSDALKSAKNVLGIASPSKAFAQIGRFTGEGYVAGVEAMTGPAQNAMAAMVDPPVASVSPLARQSAGATPGGGGAVASAPASGAAGSSGARASVTGNTFIFNGVPDAENAEQRFTETLTRLLEGDAAGLGAST